MISTGFEKCKRNPDGGVVQERSVTHFGQTRNIDTHPPLKKKSLVLNLLIGQADNWSDEAGNKRNVMGK